MENIIDDWVLLCFFVGNDFLPHLPSLDIKEGAIDKLVGIYKSKLTRVLRTESFLFKSRFLLSFSEVVRETGGYMTRDGVANLNRVEYVMRAIGRMEDSIFKKRREDECRRRIRDEKRKHQNKNHRQFGDKARNEGRDEVRRTFRWSEMMKIN